MIHLALTTVAVAGTCDAPVTTPSDVAIELSLAVSQTTFREGELIPLIVKYVSSAENKYAISTRKYDRSGRLDVESFCLQPDSARDPLADYFSGGAFVGGGIGGSKILDHDGYTFDFDLNEWKSLPPGSYSLRIASKRVGPNKAEEPLWHGSIQLTSNTITFNVVPSDRDWEAQILGRTISELDNLDPDSPAARSAARRLRFLGSEAATRELARRFILSAGQSNSWEFKFGLFASSHRRVAIEELRKTLARPDAPISNELIGVIAKLQKLSDLSEQNASLPTDPQLRLQEEARQIQQLTEKITRELTTTLPAKTGKARAISAAELMDSQVPLGSSAVSTLRSTLLASWDSLPADRQNQVISHRWDEIGGPEFLPLLRKIVASPTSNKLERGPALLRILELDPAEGRRLVLDEIKTPRNDIGIRVLGRLPDHEMPSIEDSVLARLDAQESFEIDFQIIDRYFSSRQFERVKLAYESRRGKWACEPQSALLRYFLRVLRDYGEAEVRKALHARAHTGCYQTVLSSLRAFVSLPNIEGVVIRSLLDDSFNVQADATNALRHFGTSKAVKPLLARLRLLQEQRGGTKPVPGWTEQNFHLIEQSLVGAITSAQGWLFDTSLLLQLRPLVSEKNEFLVNRAEESLKLDALDLHLYRSPGGELAFNLGHYHGTGTTALKEKLSQLPRTTILAIVTTRAQYERNRKLYAEGETILNESGRVHQVRFNF